MPTKETGQTAQEQNEEAMKGIADFFDRFTVQEAQQHIWELLSAAIGSENADFWSRHQRGSNVWFCQQVDLLIQAAAVLHEQQAGKSQQA